MRFIGPGIQPPSSVATDRITEVGGAGHQAIDVGGQWVTRRRIQVALGVLWLLDGLLQLQPFMFGRGFATQVIAPSAAGQPAWVAWPVDHAASVIGSQPLVLDVLFASVQIALGIGFLWPKTVRLTAICSVLWAAGIWLFGEGLGGLAGGKAALLTGAPGAAVLYAVVALAAWPGSGSPVTTGSRTTGGVAAWFPFAWAVVWLDLALLAILPGNRTVVAVTDQVTGATDSVPGWLGHIDRIAGQWVHDLGVGSIVVLVVVPAAIGLLGLGGARLRRVAAWSGVAVALVAWVVGQSFGFLASGMATDPNTAPLLVLCSVALLGVRTSRARHVQRASTPIHRETGDGSERSLADQAPVVGVG